MGRVERSLAIAAAVLVAAACGGAGTGNSPSTAPAVSPSASASPSVAPTPRPTPTPSPTATPGASEPETIGIVSDRYPYSMYIPTDWETGQMGDADAFRGPAGEQVDVRYYPSIAEDEEAWFAKARTVLDGFAPIAHEQEYPHPAGAARWFELHPTQNGQTLTLYRVVLISAGDGWDITWVSPAGFESVDEPLFVRVATSFWPSTGPINVWSVGVGGCFTSLRLGEPAGGSSSVFLGPVDGFAAVDCAEEHTGEVIAALDDLEAECDASFEPYVGRALAGSALALYKFIPLPGTALASGVEALCIVTDVSGTSTGTARGSAR